MKGKENYALVTGGSSGMGLEYARQLAGRGYNVIVAALPGTVDAVVEELRAKYPGQDFLPVGMNLACQDAAGKLVDEVARQRPDAAIEVLVNNAGVIHIAHFRAMTAAQVETELLLHNLTCAKLCHILLPRMAERGKGYVLNVSSLAAWLPFPFISTYCATKAFNRMLTRALRTEYHGSGVNVATVYFGAVDTPLYRLSEGKRHLARRLGVMITPEKAVRKALKMLFGGHSGRMPGLVNKVAYIVCPLLPRPLIALIDRKVSQKLGLK